MQLIQKYKYELILAIILVGFTAFQWNSLFLPYFWDELAYYSKAALHMHDNGLSLLPSGLPSDLSRGHPLLFQFMGGLWFKIFGTSLFVGHSLPFLISLITIIFTYKIGVQLSNKLTGLIAAVLLLIQPIFIAQSTLILPEITLGLFTVLSIYFLLKENILISLFFSILLVLTKEVGIVISIAISLYIYWKNKSVKQAIIHLIPILVLILFLIIQKIQIGWFFFPFHVSLISFNIIDVLQRFSKSIYFIFFAQGRYFFIPIMAFLAYHIYNNKQSKDRSTFFVVSFLAVTLYILLHSSFRGMNRYFLFLLPLIAISISIALSEIKRIKTVFFYPVLLLLLPALFYLKKQEAFNIDADFGYKNAIVATQTLNTYLIGNNYVDKKGFCHFSILRAFGDIRLGYINESAILDLQEEKNILVNYAIEINPDGWNRDLSYWAGFTLVKSIKEGNFEILIYAKQE